MQTYSGLLGRKTTKKRSYLTSMDVDLWKRTIILLLIRRKLCTSDYPAAKNVVANNCWVVILLETDKRLYWPENRRYIFQGVRSSKANSAIVLHWGAWSLFAKAKTGDKNKNCFENVLLSE